MTSKLRMLFGILLIALTIGACQNRQQKIDEFVTYYNGAAERFTNPPVEQTSAEAISENEIRITFRANASVASGSENTFEERFRPVVAGLLGGENLVMELIDQGVKFDFVLIGANGSKLSNLLVDKTKAEELLENPIVFGQTQPNASPELQQALQIMNEELPIVDQAAGTTVTSITINDNMALVYNAEVNDTVAENLKEPGTAALMKQTLLRDPGVRNMLTSLTAYGVTAITYKYVDMKGKTITEASVNASELK